MTDNWVTGTTALEQLAEPVDLCVIPVASIVRVCCCCPKRLAHSNKGKRCFTCERKYVRKQLRLDKL